MEPKKGLSSRDERWTLEDYIMDLIDRKQTDTQEFKSMIHVYGREKLAEIYKKFVTLKNGGGK